MDKEKRRHLFKTLNLQYDHELPIVQRRPEIIDLIRTHQIVVVCGETGSGKSTQLPKFCLEIGRGINGFIGHTQPRRIAARSIAARIAEELHAPTELFPDQHSGNSSGNMLNSTSSNTNNSSVGAVENNAGNNNVENNIGYAVGYKVRFDEKCGTDTLIKLMTDGILLAESQSDRNFRQYDTIIIDEAHERSLNIDFLLGMLKRILPQRPDLKLIITSATIDAKRFANHFSEPNLNNGNAVPVIEVSGRTYPIDIRYKPISNVLTYFLFWVTTATSSCWQSESKISVCQFIPNIHSSTSRRIPCRRKLTYTCSRP